VLLPLFIRIIEICLFFIEEEWQSGDWRLRIQPTGSHFLVAFILSISIHRMASYDNNMVWYGTSAAVILTVQSYLVQAKTMVYLYAAIHSPVDI
jgi:hypothetical protein